MRRPAESPPPDWKKRMASLPRDWKNRVEGDLRRYSPSMQEQMLRLLGREKVHKAARSLWNAARECPGVREELHVLVGDALYEVALARQPRAWRRRTAVGWLNIAEALDAVLDDNLCFRDNGPSRAVIDGVACEVRADQASWARKDLKRAALKYRQLSANASRTKPQDFGQREALITLRQIFEVDLGDSCDDAVALLMEAAFGGVWTVDIVRSRASEWKSPKARLKKARE